MLLHGVLWMAVLINGGDLMQRLSSELEALHQSISRQKKRIKAMEESSKALLAEYDGSHNMKLQVSCSQIFFLVGASCSWWCSMCVCRHHDLMCTFVFCVMGGVVIV